MPARSVVTTQEFALFTGAHKRNGSRDLKSAVKNLYQADIKFTEGKKEVRTRWVQECSFCEETGAAILVWGKRIKKYLSDLRGNYTSYFLHDVIKFKSFYAIRVYEILIRNKNMGVKKIELEDFRFQVGAENKHPTFKELNARVIKPSLKQINDKSNIRVSCEFKKQRRVVKSLEFFFQEKSDSPLY
jgi:plasmid replication initiation protein